MEELKQYQDIGISIGGARCHSAVFSEMVHARIEQVTDKAIQIRPYDIDSKDMKLEKHTAWIPKKALIKPKPIPGYGELHYYRLADWFQPGGFTEWFLNRYSHVGGVSAAQQI